MNTRATIVPASTGWYELKKHWRVLLGACIGIFFGASGLMPYVAGIFAKEQAAYLGTSLSVLASIAAGVSLVTGITAPICGGLIDRYGMLPVAIVGFVGMTFGLVAQAACPRELIIYTLAYGAILWFGTATTAIAFLRPLRDVFVARKGLAVGVLLASVGLAATVVPVPLTLIVQAYGWRIGYLSLAVASVFGGATGLAILASTTASGVRRPHKILNATDRPATRVDARNSVVPTRYLRDPVLWLLVTAFALLAGSTSGYIFHLVPMLTGLGLPQTQAAVAQSSIGLGMILVRLFIGALLDRVFGPKLMILLIVGVASGLLALTVNVGGHVGIIVAAVALGLTYGSEVDLIGYLASRYFDEWQFGKAMGIVYGTAVFANGASAVAISMISRNGQNYHPALFTSLLICLTSAAIFNLLPPYRYE